MYVVITLNANHEIHASSIYETPRGSSVVLMDVTFAPQVHNTSIPMSLSLKKGGALTAQNETFINTTEDP